jgi:hypothetical protein
MFEEDDKSSASVIDFATYRDKISARREREAAQMAALVRGFLRQHSLPVNESSERGLRVDVAEATSCLMDMAVGTFEVLRNQVLTTQQWQDVAQLTAELAREIAHAVGLSHDWERCVESACVNALALPLFPSQALRVARAQVARLRKTSRVSARWARTIEETLKAIRTADTLYVATATEQFTTALCGAA